MTQQVNFDEVPPLTLGWRLQMALKKGELTQADLMSKFEVSRQTISRWCNDVGAAPKRFILEEIATMCGVSVNWLIDGSPEPEPPPDPHYGPPSPLRTLSSKSRKGSAHSTYKPDGWEPNHRQAA